MSQFWIKQTPDAPMYGPFTGAQLKQFAAERRVAPTSLISPDQKTWHVANTVKGLFAAAAPAQTGAPAPQMPAIPASASATQSIPAQSIPGQAMQARSMPAYVTPAHATSAQATPAQAIPYHTPGSDITQLELKHRSVGAFAFVTGLIVVAYVFTLCATWLLESTIGTMLGVATFFLLLIPALILWLTWVNAAHKDLKFLTNGAYQITPGQAVGFSFIPVFDAFWVVYMPYKLATELNLHLAARGRAQIPTGAVLTCQIASVVVAFPLPLLTPALYAISMWLVQSGFNRLVTTPAAAPASRHANYGAALPA